MLNALYEYTTRWSLNVNISKTKIVIFRNGGVVRDSEKWYYNGELLETVDNFTYLGCVLHYNGKFNNLLKRVTDQGRKALFALHKNIKNMYLNYTTLLSLF